MARANLAAFLLLLAGVECGHMSKTSKKKQIQHLKEQRMMERSNMRAERSAKKTMYHPIAASWAASGIECEAPLSGTDDFVVALASDDADPVPIFAAINSTLTNTRRRQLDFVAFVSRDCASLLSHTHATTKIMTQTPGTLVKVPLGPSRSPSNDLAPY